MIMRLRCGLGLLSIWLCFLLLSTSCHSDRSSALQYSRDSTQIVGLYQQGHQAANTGNNSGALEYYRAGLAESRKRHRRLLEGIGLANLSAMLGIIGKTDSMQFYAGQSIAIFNAEHYRGPYYFNTRLNTISNYMLSSDYAPLIGEVLDVLAEAKSERDTPYMGKSLSMLGIVANNNHDYEKAIGYQEQALALLRPSHDTEQLYNVLSNTASLFGEMKRHGDELRIAREALQHGRPNVSMDAYTYDYLADAHRGLGHPDSALYYLDKAKAATLATGLDQNMVNIYSSYVDIYHDQHDARAAMAALDSGLAMMRRLDINTLVPGFLATKAELLEEQGDYKGALRLQRISDSLKNVAYGEQTRQQIAELETKYKTREQQASIQSLSRTTRQQRQWLVAVLALLALSTGFGTAAMIQFRRQRRANRVISEQAEKLEWLMKEIHHRVKNNLQVITSLINMQLRQNTTPGAERLLADTASRIQSIALIHQKLYQHKEQEQVFMQDYIQMLAQSLIELHGDAQIDIEAGTYLDIDTAVLLGLTLTELITNSCKYARQPGQPLQISIAIQQLGAGYKLLYRDNGPGITEASEQPTMGLRIIRLMTQQLKGQISSANKGGVVYAIDFKDERQRKQVA